MVVSTNTTQHDTTCGCGIKHTFLIDVSAASITLPEESTVELDAQLSIVNHPLLLVPKQRNNSLFQMGIEKLYNVTKDTDVSNFVLKIENKVIRFDPTVVSTGDQIEVTCYTNATAWDDKETIKGEWIEQLYRHSTHLDRIDFGSFTPSFEWAKDNSDYDEIGWAYHQRLFYNFAGWYHEDDRNNSSISAGDTMEHNKKTILSWSPNATSIVGTFAGDPALNKATDINDKFTVQPVPFYLTGMTFYCKMKNTDYDTEKGSAVELDITIDGMNDAMGSSPGYELSTTEREIKSAFGNDNKLYISMSSSVDYKGLTPVYKYGRQMDSTDYGIAHKRLGCRATSLNVSARLVGDDADWTELDEWYLTFSGWIMYGYDTS